MSTDDLVEAYFDRNPPVIALVRNLIVELADTITKDYPNQPLEASLMALDVAQPILRKTLRQIVENGLKQADSVTINTEAGSHEFRRGHLSRIWSPPEADETHL